MSRHHCQRLLTLQSLHPLTTHSPTISTFLQAYHRVTLDRKDLERKKRKDQKILVQTAVWNGSNPNFDSIYALYLVSTPNGTIPKPHLRNYKSTHKRTPFRHLYGLKSHCSCPNNKMLLLTKNSTRSNKHLNGRRFASYSRPKLKKLKTSRCKPTNYKAKQWIT